MIQLTAQTQILICIQPADFRCQIDGLAALCRNKLNAQPNSGTLFAFINRHKTMIRFLCYRDQGYWIATKRLSRGKFKYWPARPDTPVSPLAAEQLMKILRSGSC